MNLTQKFHIALSNLPPPGLGNGTHTALLGCANLGVLAGLDASRIFDRIRKSIAPGKRFVNGREIWDAIEKATADHTGGKIFRPKANHPIFNGKAALQKVIEQGKYCDEADLWEVSPIRLNNTPQQDALLLLETIYKPSDLIWIGERNQPGIIGETIRTCAEWIKLRTTASHIIPNTLNGLPMPKKSGDGDTLRGDLNVSVLRFCTVEFDNLSYEEQIRFWTGAKLPIVALINSGGKSIHAWLDVQKLAKVETAEDWQTNIEERLYKRLLIPLGVDAACSNPARLSRLPGHFRKEGNYQRLLWLSPTGRAITC